MLTEGVTSKRYILEATGSGVAILDYDGDGYPDIFLVNGTYLHSEAKEAGPPPTSHLFHNNHDGTFTDVTAKSGLDRYRLGPGRLRRRLRQRRLPRPVRHRLRQEPPLPQRGRRPLHARSPSRPASPAPERVGHRLRFRRLRPRRQTGHRRRQLRPLRHRSDCPSPARPRLHVEGRAGHVRPARPGVGAEHCSTTTSATASSKTSPPRSGIDQTNGHYCSPSPRSTPTTTAGPTSTWPATPPRHPLPQQPRRHLHRRAADAGVAFNEDGREQAGMGSTVADYDGDGHLDIFKTNFSDDTATLYRDNGDGTFDDVTFLPVSASTRTNSAGAACSSTSTTMAGPTSSRQRPRLPRSRLQPSRLRLSRAPPALSQSRQRQIRRQPKIPAPASPRPLSAVVLPSPISGTMAARKRHQQRQFSSHAARQSHRESKSLDRARTHRHKIQSQCHRRARHRPRHRAAKRVWVNEVRSGSSYNSSSDMRLHFGLGPSPVLKEVEISWPSGLTEVFRAPSVDRITALTEGAGKPLATKSAK